MPFTPLDRIVSLGNDGVYTSTMDANDAREHLRLNDGTFAAVQVSNPFSFWPRLDNYANDPNPNPIFSGTLPPQFIWNKAQAQPGDDVYFAVGSKLISINGNTTADFSVYLTSFADNAHTVEEIRLFEVGQIPPLPPAFTPVKDLVDGTPPLIDGPFTQPIEPAPPFGWQTVRFYSDSFSFFNTNATPRSYRIIVVFRAINYPVPSDANFNPGGLAFQIDIYSQNATLAPVPVP